MLYCMKGYSQFCPVALAAEVFAERWTPLILRELLSGALRFADIHRGVPRMSRNLLCQRLDALAHIGIIERKPLAHGRGSEYHLTEAGRAFGPVVESLGAWGYKWSSRDLRDEHLDPDFLIWVLRRLVRIENLPDHRVVDVRTLADICLGHVKVCDAVSRGWLTLLGARHICKDFSSWLGTAHYASPVAS
jgi:DNA-binding HxlR family transcriptional regulator